MNDPAKGLLPGEEMPSGQASQYRDSLLDGCDPLLLVAHLPLDNQWTAITCLIESLDKGGHADRAFSEGNLFTPLPTLLRRICICRPNYLNLLGRKIYLQMI